MINKIYVKIRDYIKSNWKFLLFLIVFIFLLNYRLPYVINTPGGHVNLEDRININGGSKQSGSYNMAYVKMVYATPMTMMLSYVIPNWDADKLEDVTLEGQSLEELEAYQKINMNSSKDIATIVAYKKASKGVIDIKSLLNVTYIINEENTELKIGDIIYEVNNIKNPSIEDIKNYLSTKKEGDSVIISVLRDDKIIKTSSVIDENKKVGISFIETYEYKTTPKIELDLKESESGPSGGFMMSLAIYDTLVKEDLTKGRKIVGTGTIDIDGNVGEIDGIKYKLLGNKDADIFFCSEYNYKEAKKVVDKYDLDVKLVMVKTLSDAIEYLKK